MNETIAKDNKESRFFLSCGQILSGGVIMKKYLISALFLLGFMAMVSFAMSRFLHSELGTTPRVIRPVDKSPDAEAPPQYVPLENQSLLNNDDMNAMIKLPPPVLRGTMTLEESLERRRSVRSYKPDALTLAQVSQILWSAYGISDSTTYTRRKLRTAPSAGATYPLEIYLMVNNVEGLSPGLYKYVVDAHALTLHAKGDVSKAVAKACLEQMMLHQAPVSLIYAAVYERVVGRYGDRGADRYLCMDIGHSAQNVYLQATAMGLATCAIGAFDDEKLTAVIKPPVQEVLMYLLPVGIPE